MQTNIPHPSTLETPVAFSANGSLRTHVYFLVKRGFAVFPCHPGTKVPACKWKDVGAADPALVESYWFDGSTYNVAVYAGKSLAPEGYKLVVLDLDCKPGKPNGLKVLRDAGVLPDEIWTTLVVRTPSGGYHLYLYAPVDWMPAIKHASGFDVQIDAAYVVAPPSSLPDGSYTWYSNAEAPIQVMPEVLMKFLGMGRPGPEAPPMPTSEEAVSFDPVAENWSQDELQWWNEGIATDRVEWDKSRAVQTVANRLAMMSHRARAIVSTLAANVHCWSLAIDPQHNSRTDPEEKFKRAMEYLWYSAWKAEQWVYRPRADEIFEKIWKLTKDQLLAQLEKLSLEKLKATWVYEMLSAELTNTEEDDVLEWLVSKGVGKKRPLSQDWKAKKKEHQTRDRRNKAKAEFEDIRGGRREIVLGTDRVPMLEEMVEALRESPSKHKVMVYNDPLVRLVDKSPSHMHKIDEPEVEAPPVVQLAPFNARNLATRVEEDVVFVTQTQEGPVREAVPINLCAHLLDEFKLDLPHINALVSHPVLTRDGRLINQEGLDEASGVYVHLGGQSFDPLPAFQTEDHARHLAAEALGRIEQVLFSEFVFAEPRLGMTGAIAMLLTGLFRKVVDLAPGWLVNASIQGSGKTTLARETHLVLTGRDMPVANLAKDRTELEKAMISYLLAQIPMLCFDNLDDGSSLKSTILAQVLTATEFGGRMLGVSKEVSLPTNLLISATGNNIVMDADIAERFLEITLGANVADPRTRCFQVPNVVAHVRKHRWQVIRDALTLVAAYQYAGAPRVTEAGSGFHQWDDMVRWPLIWAGAADTNEIRALVKSRSPELLAKNAIPAHLGRMFGEAEFTPSQLLERLPKSGVGFIAESPLGREELNELVGELREINDRALLNAKALGGTLRKLLGWRTEQGLFLTKSGRYFQVEGPLYLL